MHLNLITEKRPLAANADDEISTLKSELLRALLPAIVSIGPIVRELLDAKGVIKTE